MWGMHPASGINLSAGSRERACFHLFSGFPSFVSVSFFLFLLLSFLPSAFSFALFFYIKSKPFPAPPLPSILLTSGFDIGLYLYCIRYPVVPWICRPCHLVIRGLSLALASLLFKW
jgi:hypothetical protein